MAAVAVARAVERVSGAQVGIKWTNDLVLGGKKLCGILTEMALEGETGAVQSLVIGAGVNVSHRREDFSPDVAEIAASLAMEGYEVSRPALAAAMIEELSLLAGDLGGDPAPWLADYRCRCVTPGERGAPAVARRPDPGHGPGYRRPVRPCGPPGGRDGGDRPHRGGVCPGAVRLC